MDYRKMWEEIGMDVETHDMLCEVLPQAFGDVYLTQDNRPECMDYFNMVIGDVHGIRPAELMKLKEEENKKVVGTFCIHVPDEIVLAAGAIATGLCSGSQFWVPGGERVLPTSTCPLVKASMGARLDKTCPFFRIADVFVGENSCDAKKKAWEIMKTDAPMYVMDLPQEKKEADFEHWKNELYKYKEMLENLTGNKVTKETLRDAIKISNNKRRALRRLNEFRKLKNVPISGKDVLLITQIAFY